MGLWYPAARISSKISDWAGIGNFLPNPISTMWVKATILNKYLVYLWIGVLVELETDHVQFLRRDYPSFVANRSIGFHYIS